MRVVADTNVYVSAIVFGGKPQAILDLAQDGQIELFISDEILAETTRILRDKFHRTPEQLRSDVLAIEALTMRVQPVEKIDAVPADPTMTAFSSALLLSLTPSSPATPTCCAGSNEGDKCARVVCLTHREYRASNDQRQVIAALGRLGEPRCSQASSIRSETRTNYSYVVTCSPKPPLIDRRATAWAGFRATRLGFLSSSCRCAFRFVARRHPARN